MHILSALVLPSTFIALAFPVNLVQQVHQTHQASVTLRPAEPIQLSVTVTDKHGGMVKGLKPNNFEISIEQKSAKIVSFSDVDSPVSVGIVFDSSGSMSNRSLRPSRKNFNLLREAFRRFLDLGNDKNEYFLLGFNIQPQLLVDWTSDRTKVVGSFHGLSVVGNTALYDACYLAVDKLQRGRHGKRVLILMSDGQDNISHYSFKEVRELLKNAGVILYAVNFPGEDYYRGTFEMEGESTLRELSLLTGGLAIYSKSGHPLSLKDAPSVFELIAIELRHQYNISVMPDESNAGKKWRKIRVKVNAPPDAPNDLKNLRARTRSGYY